MTTSPDLGIPFIDSQQDQPEVTHNEALLLLQALLNGVISVGPNTPAVGPTIGDSYIIGAAPTGAWAGRANCVTIWSGTAWDFIPGETSAGTPITMGARQEGMRVWVRDEDTTYVWSGSAWGALSTGASQAGIASSIASNDFYLADPHTGNWITSTIVGSTTQTIFAPLFLDSDITIDGLAIRVVAAGVGQTFDLGIYNFLGAGKPGTAIVSGQGSLATAGAMATITVASTDLAAGVYFIALHCSVASGPTCIGATANASDGARHTMVLLSDGYDQLANGSNVESANYLVNDSALPGGSYSLGMDLTGLDISTANMAVNTWSRRIFLRKA